MRDQGVPTCLDLFPVLPMTLCSQVSPRPCVDLQSKPSGLVPSRVQSLAQAVCRGRLTVPPPPFYFLSWIVLFLLQNGLTLDHLLDLP